MKFLSEIKKVNLFFLLKTGIGSAIAILIADSLGLAYSTSAGIITLLTIQNTKKETIAIALKRMVAFVLAVLIAFAMFSVLGYTAIAFGFFVILFVALCLLWDLKDGIAMNAVLTTHFLIERSMRWEILWNETALLLIGVLIGIVLNMIMPRYLERIRRQQLKLEEEIKKTLRGIAALLRDKEACLVQPSGNRTELPDDPSSIHEYRKTPEIPLAVEEQLEIDFIALDALLEELLKKAYEDAGNTLTANTKYLLTYLEMRKLQLEVLKNIRKTVGSIPVILRQTFPVAEFLEHIAASFHELNNAQGLLKELDSLYEHFRKEALPNTRDEFEYRAMLFQILKDLEYFLVLKRNFIAELELTNMKSYWAK